MSSFRRMASFDRCILNLCSRTCVCQECSGGAHRRHVIKQDRPLTPHCCCASAAWKPGPHSRTRSGMARAVDHFDTEPRDPLAASSTAGRLPGFEGRHQRPCQSHPRMTPCPRCMFGLPLRVSGPAVEKWRLGGHGIQSLTAGSTTSVPAGPTGVLSERAARDFARSRTPAF